LPISCSPIAATRLSVSVALYQRSDF